MAARSANYKASDEALYYANQPGAVLRVDPNDKKNYPVGKTCPKIASNTCDNWFKMNNGCCTGVLTNLRRSVREFEPNFCRDCAEEGRAGGKYGKDTGLRLSVSQAGDGRPTGWDYSLTTRAQRRAAGLPGGGGTMSMTDAEVDEVLQEECLRDVVALPPGMARGRLLGSEAMYNFTWQLQQARDAPKGSRHRLVFVETELLIGLFYHEMPVYHYDIERRGVDKSKPFPAGNRWGLYDAAIFCCVQHDDPFEHHHPDFNDADKSAFYNPAPVHSGILDNAEVARMGRKLQSIQAAGGYVVTWFGNEKSIAEAFGCSSIIIDAGYPARNTFGATLNGSGFRGTQPVAGEDDEDGDDEEKEDPPGVKKLRTPADLLGMLLCGLRQRHRAAPDAGDTQPGFIKVLFMAVLEAYIKLMGAPPPIPPPSNSKGNPLQ